MKKTTDKELTAAKTEGFNQGKIEGYNQALKDMGTWAMQNGISGAKVAEFQKQNKKR